MGRKLRCGLERALCAVLSLCLLRVQLHELELYTVRNYIVSFFEDLLTMASPLFEFPNHVLLLSVILGILRYPLRQTFDYTKKSYVIRRHR